MFFNLFQQNKKYCLVLSGGGSKGFFHLGIIKAIRELGIEIAEISGTSAGALVGAMYASNPDFDIDFVVKDLNLLTIANFLLSKNDEKLVDKIQKKLKKYISANTFRDLKIPFSFNATDINTGEEVVFRDGNIFPNIIASMAIPQAFPLIHYKGRLLCDGGVVNNLPISTLKNKNLPIIACDLNFGLKEIKSNSNGFDALFNAFLIMQKQESIETILEQKRIKHRKIYLLKLKQYFNMFDYRKSTSSKLVKIGYEQAISVLRNIKK